MPRFLLATAACLLTATLTLASAPPHVPLATMISQSEAVAIVRIDAIEDIERPKNLPLVWHPNRLVKLTVVESWRGKLPDSFKARVEVLDYRNPSAKVGGKALVFAGSMIPSEGREPEGHVHLYEAAQGFLAIDDLTKDPQLSPAALDALRVAVQKYRKPENPKLHGGWNPHLNDEAAQPFIDLQKRQEPLLRAWGVNALSYAQVSPIIGQCLIAALNDPDAMVSRSAAHGLMGKRYRPATEALRQFQRKGPADDYLAKQLPLYLAGMRVEDQLAAMPAPLVEGIQRQLLDEHTPSMAFRFDLRIEADKPLALELPFGKFDPGVLDGIRTHLQKLDITKLEAVPYSGQLYLWKEEGKPGWKASP